MKRMMKMKRNPKNLAALFVATSAKRELGKCVEDCEGFGDSVGHYEKSAKLGGDCNELIIIITHNVTKSLKFSKK